MLTFAARIASATKNHRSVPSTGLTISTWSSAGIATSIMYSGNYQLEGAEIRFVIAGLATTDRLRRDHMSRPAPVPQLGLFLSLATAFDDSMVGLQERGGVLALN